MSMLVYLRLALLSGLARILGKPLGPTSVYTLCKLFNCYFSTLQITSHFVIILAIILLAQTHHACITRTIALTLTLEPLNALKTIMLSKP